MKLTPIENTALRQWFLFGSSGLWCEEFKMKRATFASLLAKGMIAGKPLALTEQGRAIGKELADAWHAAPLAQ